MGFAWNGACYETTADALAAFALTVPSANASGINAFTTAPTIDASGIVSWSISNRPLNDTVATVRTGTTQLQTCDFDSFGASSTPDIVIIVAMIFALFMGFRAGQTA